MEMISVHSDSLGPQIGILLAGLGFELDGGRQNRIKLQRTHERDSTAAGKNHKTQKHNTLRTEILSLF